MRKTVNAIKFFCKELSLNRSYQFMKPKNKTKGIFA